MNALSFVGVFNVEKSNGGGSGLSNSNDHDVAHGLYRSTVVLQDTRTSTYGVVGYLGGS
jgi:hypothetical protein